MRLISLLTLFPGIVFGYENPEIMDCFRQKVDQISEQITHGNFESEIGHYYFYYLLGQFDAYSEMINQLESL